MVLHGLAGQIPEPGRNLGLQVTMGQTSCLLATQPLHRLREQLPQGTERILVGFQCVRLHLGSFFLGLASTPKTVEKEPLIYRSTRPWPPETQRQQPSRDGAAPIWICWACASSQAVVALAVWVGCRS